MKRVVLSAVNDSTSNYKVINRLYGHKIDDYYDILNLMEDVMDLVQQNNKNVHKGGGIMSDLMISDINVKIPTVTAELVVQEEGLPEGEVMIRINADNDFRSYVVFDTWNHVNSVQGKSSDAEDIADAVSNNIDAAVKKQLSKTLRRNKKIKESGRFNLSIDLASALKAVMKDMQWSQNTINEFFDFYPISNVTTKYEVKEDIVKELVGYLDSEEECKALADDIIEQVEKKFSI